jgi:hypothetical protein
MITEQPNQRVTVDRSNVTIQGVSLSQNVQKAPVGQESRETPSSIPHRAERQVEERATRSTM